MTDRELAGCALLPCPFCGGGGYWRQGRCDPSFYVACKSCETIGPVTITLETAIAAWNHRTPSSEGDGRDGERLLYLAKDGGVEGFCHVKADIYDYACDAAEESGRDEPNDADILSGMRRLIDAAIAAAEGDGSVQRRAPRPVQGGDHGRAG